MDPRSIRLRVELYSAAQMLKGEDAEEFWKLIGEINSIRVICQPSPQTGEDT